MNALAQRAVVVDLPAQPPAPIRRALQLLYARPSASGWQSHWVQSSAIDRWHQWRLSSLVRQDPCDHVVQVHDLAPLDVPYYIYQDLSYDAVLANWDNPGVRDQFSQFRSDLLCQRRDRQLSLYSGATGIIAMSKWFADSLVKESNVPYDKIHVAHPGASALSRAPASLAIAERVAPRRKLLFIGKAFYRKGGDIVVEAFKQLRAAYDGELQLTIAGPDEWPLADDIPDGVTFEGSVSPRRVVDLMDSHDVLLLPSRFEAFGIVVAEALARGLPCVVRDAFALPEMVSDGVNGRTIAHVDAVDLADAVSDVLSNDDIYRTCAEQVPMQRRHYSWSRAGDDVMRALGLGASRETTKP